ncbi:MAG: hypothetical protein COT74_13520 [Bdellovibrionales bacterium CG10_big_fil_rev_8_21_14_0_10_45_34]|nr:MAG: hypothetical protein COT74_13520 [Bdellovibrionales bacterium CG10_big_fil_rev_8_21_14_0_10_45_34]
MAIRSIQDSVFCACCASRHRVFRKSHLGPREIIAAGVWSLSFMMIVWQEFDPRVFPIWAFSLIVCEFFVHYRWRASLICSNCGFDPVLYKKNPERAQSAVNQFVAKRRQDPSFLLTKSGQHLISRRKPIGNLEALKRELYPKEIGITVVPQQSLKDVVH